MFTMKTTKDGTFVTRKASMINKDGIIVAQKENSKTTEFKALPNAIFFVYDNNGEVPKIRMFNPIRKEEETKKNIIQKFLMKVRNKK